MHPGPAGTAGFLDKQPLDESDAKVQALIDVVIRAYDDEPEALAIAGQVGLLRAEIERHPKLRLTWWSILREAALERQLRNLIDMMLRDTTIANWHGELRLIVDAPQGSLVGATEPTAPKGERERRDASLRPEVGDKARLWKPGSQIRFRFLGGSKAVQKKVERAARGWLDYANLRFDFGRDPDADIRIAFEDLGSWSYLGTDCHKIPADEPTMNLGYVGAGTPKEDVDLFVRHEMGHALGLLHEHGNPQSDLRWDRKKVYREFQGPPNHWTREQVDANFFSVWPPRYFPLRKVFDRASIMIFPQISSFFVDGTAIEWNRELSPIDQQFMAALYPE